MRTDRLVITCEHGGRQVPRAYAALFQGYEPLLASHRGYDAGALLLARALARALGAPLFGTTITRLLVDLNRSLRHPAIFSEITRGLPVAEREHIVKRYYVPHRARVQARMAELIGVGDRVIHLAVHSFTPSLDGRLRKADAGLLYDPRRQAEARLCRAWQAELRIAHPGLRVRCNYPYLGRADGLTTALRRIFVPEGYLGIELEVNQIHVATAPSHWAEFRHLIIESLQAVLALRWDGRREAAPLSAPVSPQA